MAEHRSVLLLEDVIADLHHKVGPYSEDVSVERGVVNLAERETIGNHRVAPRMAVGKDVRSLEKLGVAQHAHRAALPVRAQDPSAELLLVHASLRNHSDVLAYCGGRGPDLDVSPECGHGRHGCGARAAAQALPLQ